MKKNLFKEILIGILQDKMKLVVMEILILYKHLYNNSEIKQNVKIYFNIQE